MESNPGFWVIQWSSFAMLLLGEELQRCLSSYPRAGKTAGEIQTSSFPTWIFLGNPERIKRQGRKQPYTLPSLKHSCIQQHTCLLPLARSTQSLSSVTDASANCPARAGAAVLVNKRVQTQAPGSPFACLALYVPAGDTVQMLQDSIP